MDLFDASGASAAGIPEPDTRAPLAVRMRPRTLEEFAGQGHLLGEGSALRRLIGAGGQSGRAVPASVILWGPAGTGKTTLAYLVARGSDKHFVEMSAVNAGVKDIRDVVQVARRGLVTGGRETVLFIDEVHRFSKSQQDALLPAVENRWVTLIAATTENPSFSVVTPLLSRSLLLTLQLLSTADIESLVDRAILDERGLAGTVRLDASAREQLVRLAGGDARKALTILEAAAGAAVDQSARADEPARGKSAQPPATSLAGAKRAKPKATSGDQPSAKSTRPRQGQKGQTGGSGDPSVIGVAQITQAVDMAVLAYDRDGDQHYDVISAFIKSIRGSDVDAAMHYLARMIAAGEDPRFIARRLIVSASEDIGMADPSALQTAVAAAQAVQLIGMPEGRIPLAEAVVHLATAPKSNAAYLAIDAALADIAAGKTGVVPAHLRDAHYAGAGRLGHGDGYRYAHDWPHAVAPQRYLPAELTGRRYYEPNDRGYERQVAERLDKVRAILAQAGEPEVTGA